MLLAGAAIAFAQPALAQESFTGTWKGDVKASQPSKKPDIFSISNGVFSCPTCVPAVTVPADGAFHAVSGHAYFDEIAVSILSPTSVTRATRLGGKPAGESTTTLAADGKTARVAFTDLTASNGVPVTGEAVVERVAPAPAGAHAVSGAWRDTSQATVSDSGLTFQMAVKGNTVEFQSPTGSAYTAVLGGPQAPVTGDRGWTSVMVKRTGPATILETDYRAGKPITVLTMTVTPDGHRMTLAIDDKLSNKQSTFVAVKQ